MAAPMTKTTSILGRRFLLRCANEHNSFRIPEITSIAKLFNIRVDWVEKNDRKVNLDHPYVLVDVSSEEDIRKIMSRSMLVRSAYELWGRGETYDELHEQLKQLPREFTEPHCNEDMSFHIRIQAYCKTLRPDKKLEKIEEFSYLPLEGPVKLEDPNTSLAVLEFYGVNPNFVPDMPYEVYFGRLICDGQRHRICKLHLRERKFIGNTSMDAQLSLIMANQGLVSDASIVYDPFVGSGSLLVAAAHFGGFVWGADIDYKMLHGKAKPTRVTQKQREHDECVAENLKQYGLASRYVDVLVADSSLSSMWRTDFVLDAILTDPPYGIREATERIGTTKLEKIKEEHLQSHYPSKVTYSIQDMYNDLLNFAAKHLKIGGRLVYWIPVILETYSEECIPKHPCLELVSNSEQKLIKHAARRLLTMIKITEPSESETNCANVSERMSLFPKQYFRIC